MQEKQNHWLLTSKNLGRQTASLPYHRPRLWVTGEYMICSGCLRVPDKSYLATTESSTAIFVICNRHYQSLQSLRQLHLPILEKKNFFQWRHNRKLPPDSTMYWSWKRTPSSQNVDISTEVCAWCYIMCRIDGSTIIKWWKLQTNALLLTDIINEWTTSNAELMVCGHLPKIELLVPCIFYSNWHRVDRMLTTVWRAWLPTAVLTFIIYGRL